MVRKTILSIRKFFAALALLSVELLIILVLFFAALFAFVFLIRRVFVLNEEKFDHDVFALIAPFVSDLNNDVMMFITFLGTHNFLIPANLVLIAYFLFIKKHRWYSISIPAIALTSTGVMFLLKRIFNRQRPLTPLLFEAEGLSFPSGHAMISFTFYGLLIYIIWQSKFALWLKWLLGLFFLTLIFFIGFSRIYLQVHYATDVMAGFCVGLIWLSISIWVLKKIERFSRKEVDPVVEKEEVHAET